MAAIRNDRREVLEYALHLRLHLREMVAREDDRSHLAYNDRVG